MSWKARDLTQSTKLLYVSDIGAEEVDLFSYPNGKPVGQLTGFNEPNGLCVGRKGNVFVTDTYNSRIVEYAHAGTSPIAILADSGNYPIGCAIDPKTGNLAVTNYSAFSPGSLMIYKRARGAGTSYQGLTSTSYCTYDDDSDVFIDGFGPSGKVLVGELKKGAVALTTYSINVDVGWPGGVQWDGKYLALGDEFANKFVSEPYQNVIYQVSIENGSADVVKTVPLAGASDVVQFWLQGKRVIGPDASNENVGFWKFPRGGNHTRTIDDFYEPVGAAVSD